VSARKQLTMAEMDALLKQATHALAGLRGDLQALAPRAEFPAQALLEKLLKHFDIRPAVAAKPRRKRQDRSEG
jgi:hypothetical protein